MAKLRIRLSFDTDNPRHMKALDIINSSERGKTEKVIGSVLYAERNTEDMIREMVEKHMSMHQTQAPPKNTPVISGSFLNNIVDMQKRGEKQNSGH